jgi:RNA polymerase sigma-70 factor (ECF subfamily)
VSTDERDALLHEAQELVRGKAKQLIRRGEFPPQDDHDLCQDLALHVLRKARAFDPAKTTRERYLAMVVRHAVADLLRDLQAGKRAGRARSLSRRVRTAEGTEELAQFLTDRHRDSRLGTATRDPLERAHLAADLAAVLAGLTDEDRALTLRLRFQTKADAGRELGLSRAQVKAGVRRIRRAFADAGLEHYLENRRPT